MNHYPKRLIEVDLPIKRISAHARREKDMRRGHIPLLHIWWATRPPAACRAVICASLWLDPADEKCPESFRVAARDAMRKWGRDHRDLMSAESFSRFESANKDPKRYEDYENLRSLLLDFIADFANWDNSTKEAYIKTSQLLTAEAHIANGGEIGSRPLAVDPFAGGGAIPLEALRVGADAFASDLNPVAVVLNKVVLEFIPRHGQKLADHLRKQIILIKQLALKELGDIYPKDSDGSTPIAYLWARTVVCEGPGCGSQVPLIRSLWLAKKAKRSIALRLVPNVQEKYVGIEIAQDVAKAGDGTVKRGSATCPVCGFTTPVASVRRQLDLRRGGADDARMVCVVTTKSSVQGRSYRLPTKQDLDAVQRATDALREAKRVHSGLINLVPDEQAPTQNGHRAVSSTILYGIKTWGDLFTSRQALALTTIARLTRQAAEGLAANDAGFSDAVRTCLALLVDKMADMNSSLCGWQPHAEIPAHVFTRQALPMVWDFAEGNPMSGSSGSPESSGKRLLDGFSDLIATGLRSGHVEMSSAVNHPLPDDSCDAFITDPPYYDAVPYADISDFFYVWLKRTIGDLFPDLFRRQLTPKEEQAIVWHPNSTEERAEYQRKMQLSMQEGRRILKPNGIGIVVFAHKSTKGWEAQLQSIIDAGWIVTGSWSIDTEMGTRMNAMGTASLASSVHLVCRPREDPDGKLRKEDVGDWRDVLRELPVRIHEWLPRLANEGVVGADAIFACLGPALEIFSRYSSVEKPNGEEVKLLEYLEYVWAAVAKEALDMIFEGADATGFEEDARLSAMWLWTLFAGASAVEGSDIEEEQEGSDDESASGKSAKSSGYVLEYDAARKIAQGLGAHLEDLTSIIEVKGDTARLLPVGERARDLFGYVDSSATEKKRKTKAQKKLFEEMEEFDYESASEIGGAPEAGATTLDRIHQTMLLFGAGRSEAVRRFLVDDGVGNDERFWRLANALSALYPSGTDEKRWVDGVLARKKGLGF